MQPNERMQRGIDLEPIARSLFIIHTGIKVEPKVLVKDWAMASLDGISSCGKHVVEIKCPGPKDHAIAISGNVPDHYYPQLQHQMWICDVEKMTYFSFDGVDGTSVEVKRDNAYIEKMVEEEKKFYKCILENIEPELDKDCYLHRDDSTWEQCAKNWMAVKAHIKNLEKQAEQLTKQLVFLSGQRNAKGAGISLCEIERKGNVNYSKIPELEKIDLDQYRSASSKFWRISID